MQNITKVHLQVQIVKITYSESYVRVYTAVCVQHTKGSHA